MSRNFELLQRLEREQQIQRERALEDQREALNSLAVTEPASDGAAIEGLPSPIVVQAGNLSGDSTSREQITKLVQRLFLLPNSSRVVVFTAAERGSGCSWLVLQAARALCAQTSGTVCLVDANFRNPCLHDYMGVGNHFGLSDAVLQPGSIHRFVRQVANSNLRLLSCGSLITNGATLLGSEIMRSRLAEIRAEFAYVLIDTPAVSECGDAIVLGQAADGMALVLQANSTRRETAQKVIADLQAAQARILGAVLNKRTFPIPERLYRKL